MTVETDRRVYDWITNQYIDTPPPNADALELLLLWAEKEWTKQQAGKPSEWDQGSWASTLRLSVERNSWDLPDNLCGTTCCIAGKAVQLAGGRLEWFSDRYPDNEFYRTPENDRPTEYVFMPEDPTKLVGIREAAQRFLHLTEQEANDLFHGGNNIEDVRRVINELIEKARGANLTEV